MITREEVRAALTGPITSVHTPFRQDGEIDYPALRHFIDICIAGGSKTILLTYGDSLYSLLTDAEVAEITKAIVDHTAGRAMVVAADRQWPTVKEVEFAQYAAGVGADMLMVLPPDWAASCTTQTFVEHYAAVARHIPVMLVTNVFRRSAALGFEVMQRLRDEVEGVMAVKDDIGGDFARKMALLVHEQWAVFAGGQKQNHMNMWPYGCDGYMSTFLLFKPEVTHRYWQAVQAQDLDGAVSIIRDYDMPFFDRIINVKGGFTAGLHATYELFGVAQRWRRPPYYNFSDAEMENLAGFYKSKGWLPS